VISCFLLTPYGFASGSWTTELEKAAEDGGGPGDGGD